MGIDTRSSLKICLKKYNRLPLYHTGMDNGEEISFIDGNSKGCRALHAYFATTNKDHCPHVSFEAEVDVNGFVKCDKSKKVMPSDLFTPAQLGMFKAASLILGLGEAGIEIKT